MSDSDSDSDSQSGTARLASSKKPQNRDLSRIMDQDGEFSASMLSSEFDSIDEEMINDEESLMDSEPESGDVVSKDRLKQEKMKTWKLQKTIENLVEEITNYRRIVRKDHDVLQEEHQKQLELLTSMLQKETEKSKMEQTAHLNTINKFQDISKDVMDKISPSQDLIVRLSIENGKVVDSSVQVVLDDDETEAAVWAKREQELISLLEDEKKKNESLLSSMNGLISNQQYLLSQIPQKIEKEKNKSNAVPDASDRRPSISSSRAPFWANLLSPAPRRQDKDKEEGEGNVNEFQKRNRARSNTSNLAPVWISPPSKRQRQ